VPGTPVPSASCPEPPRSYGIRAPVGRLPQPDAGRHPPARGAGVLRGGRKSRPHRPGPLTRAPQATAAPEHSVSVACRGNTGRVRDAVPHRR
jgi:hypothetical protein